MNNLCRISDLNVFKLKFDDSLLDEIRESYRQDLSKLLNHPSNQYIFEGGKEYRLSIGQQDGNYFLTTYGSNPLLWFSSNNEDTYQIYKRFLNTLNIEDDIRELVDYNDKIIMYCGFLVIGNQAPNETWHVDYHPGANAYTLITPLFELDQNHGNILYRNTQNQIERHSYEVGEALVFGDNFTHTTEKYNRTNKLRIMVSMTFGTDKIEHWDILSTTIETQSLYLMLPCGHINGTCQCYNEWKLRKQGEQE